MLALAWIAIAGWQNPSTLQKLSRRIEALAANPRFYWTMVTLSIIVLVGGVNFLGAQTTDPFGRFSSLNLRPRASLLSAQTCLPAPDPLHAILSAFFPYRRTLSLPVGLAALWFLVGLIC
jgi:hypothetical protein